MGTISINCLYNDVDKKDIVPKLFPKVALTAQERNQTRIFEKEIRDVEKVQWCI